jgi:hypothetical protein
VKSLWRPKYRSQVTRYIQKHFGTGVGITQLFPYMEADFPWNGTDVVDPRTARKGNHEYHGLERHARQYHVTAQYLEAAEHWLIAAACRGEMMDVQGLNDQGHLDAVEFAINNYRYNMALHRWQRQKKRYRPFPTPEAFRLNSKMMNKKDAIADAEIAAVTGICVLDSEADQTS